MFSFSSLKKHSLLPLALVLSFSMANSVGSAKFGITEAGKIYLTDAGDTFVNNVASKQVNGKLRLVKKKEAYEWMERFVKLSERKVVDSPDFTPANNLYRHLLLCDEILADLYIDKGEAAQAPLKEEDKIPAKRKEKLLAKLEELRSKLNADIQTLVSDNSRANFKVLIDFYDKALKETLDIN